jgi:hypothetical protein
LERLAIAAVDHFQPDGSYGESLQYGNYAAFSLVLAREALLRAGVASPLPLEPWVGYVRWAAHSFFYNKPLSGWGPSARPRSANFGDSGAIFRPSGDLLLHIASRGRDSHPAEAGLARWLFDTLYPAGTDPEPHDLASFGFVPGFGFLSPILLQQAAAAVPPSESCEPATRAFSCGDAFAREGETILAVRTPAKPRHATAHIHGDVQSFVLVHRNERLLLDPGHSCYRNIFHDLEAASHTHNTCTFEVPAAAGDPARVLGQRGGINRPIVRGADAPRGAVPVDLGGRRLLCARSARVSVIVSEAAPLYGSPLRIFTRFWLLCGANVLFVVDRIEADSPVRTTWNWLFNNRDGLLDITVQRPYTLIARRGGSGVKLIHCGGAVVSGPVHALVHDAYHPLPAQQGEGRPGSGHLMRFTETVPATCRTVVHAMGLDAAASVGDWTADVRADGVTLENASRAHCWKLNAATDDAIEITDENSGSTQTISQNADGQWQIRP